MVTLLLFGTPGQDRFDAARDVAARGIDGLVVIVDGEEPESWAAGRGLYRSYNPDRDLPTVVVVNRLLGEAPLPTGLEVALEVESERSVFCCGNVVDAADARRFLVELLTLILVSESDQEMELAP
jgi:signal recognition particle receptor subunit beta